MGYHQCRWNYNDEADIEYVHDSFDKDDISLDVLWLDIEYTDSKKYFTWDPVKFDNPKKMIKKLADKVTFFKLIFVISFEFLLLFCHLTFF